MKPTIIPEGNIKKANLSAYPHPKDTRGQTEKALAPGLVAPGSIRDELAKLRTVAASIQQIRLSAQRELEMARKIRADAQRYQQETEMKARSQAQQLILRTRLQIQKESEELIREASAEIQKVLADIRVIRITAQEELAAQHKYTNAARIRSLSLSSQEETEETEVTKKKKQSADKK
jgi:hypothetical protein